MESVDISCSDSKIIKAYKYRRSQFELEVIEKKIQFVSKRIETFLELEKDNSLLSTVLDISKHLIKIADSNVTDSIDEIFVIYSAMICDFCGAYDVFIPESCLTLDLPLESLQLYHDKRSLEIMDAIHKISLRNMNDECRKEFHIYCVCSVVHLMDIIIGETEECQENLAHHNSEFDWIYGMTLGDNIYPEINTELMKWKEIHHNSLNFIPIFMTLGHFYLFGPNHLYAILALKTMLVSLLEEKEDILNIWQDLVT